LAFDEVTDVVEDFDREGGEADREMSSTSVGAALMVLGFARRFGFGTYVDTDPSSSSSSHLERFLEVMLDSEDLIM